MITSKSLFRTALALGLVAVPVTAQAGTTTAVSNVAVELAAQCTVTGATVNMGTYRSTQTWGDVASVLGSYGENGAVEGSAGMEALEFGSVNCSAGAPYTLVVTGNDTNNSYFMVNEQFIFMIPMFKSLGGTPLPDANTSQFGGFGTRASFPISHVGTGAPQVLRGTMLIGIEETGALGTVHPQQQIGTIEQLSTPLSYVLTF